MTLIVSRAFVQVACECHPGRGALPSDPSRCGVRSVACSPGEFKCSSGHCIPFQFTCDGVAECSDFSDELPSFCSFRQCLAGFYRCSNNRCVPANATCDGQNDCGDYSDEANCTCTANQFRCASGHCVANSFRCDMDQDCPDASDEMGCPPPNCTLVKGKQIGRHSTWD